MASIRMENVKKSFGPLQRYCSVYDLNFEIKDGEFFCLVGHTNSGKTTTLRLIAGLEKPDSGSVFIGEEQVNEISASRREIGMLFETLALYPNRNGYDNIASPLKIKKVPKAQIHKRVMEVTKLLGIERLLERTPQTYSGGEKQRVALGRILVQHPKAFLLDEPLGALDARLRISTRAELKRIQRDMGQTMVLASHDQEDAMSMGNRIGVIKNGNIDQIGSPQELYNHPLNVYVAKTIGKPAMNIYECTLQQVNGKFIVTHEHFSLDITNSFDKLARQPKESKVLMGIRPEHVEIVEKKQGEEDIPGKVWVTEPQGSKIIIDFKMSQETVRTLAPIEKECKPDEVRWLRFRKEKIHLFEKESEESIFK